ncbi:hypothetical protein [Aporhodopirellula aestuarii]|uniref:Uncharacterized protein n=1 Tax=Aporhodopirellula aestuarii TaxID=2950107 RepID=A0ABT0U9G9_9BACT|nr:hypothetical protein [Aporhodopirellula aestuarii]MCM2373582.1 hypothetical protein [Aporhodopirellula aestuarii]
MSSFFLVGGDVNPVQHAFDDAASSMTRTSVGGGSVPGLASVVDLKGS